MDVYSTHEWRSPEEPKYHNQVIEEGRIFKFLAGLNDEIDEVRARIIGKGTLPSLEEVFSEVRREEIGKGVMLGKNKKIEPITADSIALAVVDSQANKNTSHHQKKSDESNHVWCDYYNKPHHT